MRLTDARLRNLEHVRDHGRALPRSVAGYWCRTHDLSEFIWQLPDGLIVTSAEIRAMNRWDEGHICGERLTDAGRAALSGAVEPT